MNPRVIRRAEAREDLVEHFAYIGQDNLDAAHRFLAAADATFMLLAEMPGIGATRDFRNPQLAGVRQWRVQGFDNYLIFYRRIEDGVEILRVLHAARDIQRVLEG